jgi:DNA-binding beta-propeller fold protein YncE
MMQLKITISIIYFLISGFCIQSQDIVKPHLLSPDDQYIKWIYQFPSAGPDKQTRFGDRLLNSIFGKNNSIALTKPVAVCAEDTSNYWILDQENGTMFRIREQVGDIPHFRNKSLKYFPSLVGICSLPNGKFIFSDSKLNKLFTFSPVSRELEIFNDSLILNRPTGVAYSFVNQQLWVVETNSHCITILNLQGQIIKKIGQRGIAPGEFNFPTNIWIDQFGKVFIVDALNYRIQVFSENGEIICAFGKAGDATGYFARPKGIATDSDGNIYVADALFNTIQIFDTEGNFLYNFGIQGRDKGNFWMPSGIYIDKHDFIYVADTYNSRVQVFQYLKGDQ